MNPQPVIKSKGTITKLLNLNIKNRILDRQFTTLYI